MSDWSSDVCSSDLKQSLTYERYKQMTEQERENIQILGGLRPAKSAKKGPEDLI